MALETDFIVVGSGVAGLRAAIALAETGAAVTVLTKDKASESNTEYAQGGVAVVMSEDDETELHEEDTITAGAGLCDPAAVETLVTDGTMLKVYTWYDNEMSYVSQLVRSLNYFAKMISK